MITVNRTLIVSAALIATGVVAAIDMAQSRSPLSAAAAVAARFPAAAEMMPVLSRGEPQTDGSKSDKGLAPVGDCTREHWPYIADECLTGSDSGKSKRPVRTITVERRIAKDASQLVRVPVTELASR